VLAFVEITPIWHEKYTKKQPKGIIAMILNIMIFFTRDNRHQLFLILPIPSHKHSIYVRRDCPVISKQEPWARQQRQNDINKLPCGFLYHSSHWL